MSMTKPTFRSRTTLKPAPRRGLHVRSPRPAFLFAVLLVFILSLSTTVYSQAFVPYWSARYGSTGRAQGRGVALGPDGNIILVGEFPGTITIGMNTLTSAGGLDVFIAKLSPDGVPIWSERFGGPQNDRPTSVAVSDAGDIFIVGSFSGTTNMGGSPLVSAGDTDNFIASYDATGAHRWSAGYGGPRRDDANDIAAVASGGVVIAGAFYGTVDFGNSSITASGGTDDRDTFVARFDDDGVNIWSASYGFAGDECHYYEEQGFGVAADGAGNVYASVFQRVEYICPVPVEPHYRGSLVKFDDTGVQQWATFVTSQLNDVTVDASGDAVVVGFSRGCTTYEPSEVPCDAVVARVSPTGAVLWKTLGPGEFPGWWMRYPVFDRVTTTDAGDVLVAGHFSGTTDLGSGPITSQGAHDVVLARYSAGGVHIASRGILGDGDEIPQGVAAVGDDMLVTGLFTSTINFGDLTLTASGLQDGFLAKLRPGVSFSVTSVLDVPNDNGLAVTVTFSRAEFDAPDATQPVQEYEVYRHDPTLTLIDTIQATGAATYTLTAPTLADSLATRFTIRALTADPGVYYDSTPGVGFSVDNLPPGPPRNLAYLSGILTWDPPPDPDVDHYAVYASEWSVLTSQATVIQSTTSTSLDVTGWTPNYFLVTATDEAGNQSGAASVKGPPDVTPPAPPANVVYAAGVLTWDPPPDPDVHHYAVYASESPVFDETATFVDTTELTTLDVSAWTATYFYVIAVDKDRNESDAARANGPDMTPPAAPTNLVLAGGVLTWDPPPEPDVDHYAVYASEKSGFDATATLIRSTTSTSLDVSGLSPRFFYVTATDTAGNESHAARADGRLDVTAPAPPTNVVVVTRVLTWDPPSDADLDHFNVYASESGDFDVTATFIQSTASTSVDVAGLTPTYFYVTAIDTAGNESIAARGDGSDITAPAPPTHLVLSAGVLTWDPPPDTDLDHFSVYASESAVFDMTATFIQSTASTSAVVGGLTPRYFYVTAVDSTGNESDAARVDRSDIVAPAPPTNVVLDAGVLTWTAPVDPDLDHFSVYGSAYAFFNKSVASLLVSTQSTSLDVSGWSTTYFYVTAVDTAGNESDGVRGDPPPDVTAPGAPSNFAYNDGTLSWDPVPEPDFLEVKIYGSMSPVLDQSATPIANTSETTQDVHDLPYRYYYAIAFDRTGNTSDPARAVDDVAPPQPAGVELHDGRLSWQASTARDWKHFTVYGSNVDSLDTSATQLGTTPSTTFDVSSRRFNTYFVAASDHAGNESAPTRVSVPRTLALSVYPNPFNPETTIEYVMPSAGHARIRIYDTRGALIRTVTDETAPPGAHTAVWNGRDDTGRAVAAGVYFLHFEGNGQSATRKLVLVK